MIINVMERPVNKPHANRLLRMECCLHKKLEFTVLRFHSPIGKFYSLSN